MVGTRVAVGAERGNDSRVARHESAREEPVQLCQGAAPFGFGKALCRHVRQVAGVPIVSGLSEN